MLSRHIKQEACPWNRPKLVEIASEPDYRPDWRGVPEDLPGTEAPSLVELMRVSRKDWDLFSRGSAIQRAGYAGFKRNVAVAMGNWLAGTEGDPPEEAVAALRNALEDEEPLVREHAVWALWRAGAV